MASMLHTKRKYLIKSRNQRKASYSKWCPKDSTGVEKKEKRGHRISQADIIVTRKTKGLA